MNKLNYTGYEDHCGVGRKYHEIVDEDGLEIVNQNGIICHGSILGPLFAAAPDLLAICQAISEAICCDGELNNSDIAVIAELDAAIAKAEKGVK